MKIKIFALFVLIFVIFLNIHESTAQVKGNTNNSEFKLKVFFDGNKAKSLIEKELIKEPGIVKVTADLASKTITVIFNGKISDRIKINEAIEKMGFETEFTPKNKKLNKTCKQPTEQK